MNEFIKMSIELFQPIMTVIFAWNKRRSEHKNFTECNPAQQIFHRHKMVCNGTNCFLKDHAFKLILRIHFLSCSSCVITHFSNSKTSLICFLLLLFSSKESFWLVRKFMKIMDSLLLNCRARHNLMHRFTKTFIHKS